MLDQSINSISSAKGEINNLSFNENNQLKNLRALNFGQEGLNHSKIQTNADIEEQPIEVEDFKCESSVENLSPVKN